MLDDQHSISEFRCEDDDLNDYLHESALADMTSSVARTFVLIDTAKPAQNNVAGFFTLRADSLRIQEAYFEDKTDETSDEDKDAESNDAIEVPLVELMWLARDLDWRGRHIGDALVIDALKVVKRAADCVGLIGLHLRTTKQGRKLYENYDFQEFTAHPNYDKDRYILPIQTLRNIVKRTAATDVPD